MYHIVSNCIAYLLFYPIAEITEKNGHFNTFIIFFSSITMGTCYYSIWHADGRFVRGSSAGLYGIIGAFIVDSILGSILYKSKNKFLCLKKSLSVLVIIHETINRYLYRDSVVSYATHFGGLYAGITIRFIQFNHDKIIYDIISSIIGFSLFFGATFYTYLMGYWKPALGTSVSGVPAIIFKLYIIYKKHIDKERIIPTDALVELA
tara:strand:+ start:13670 stop:14287 length:618 start_codon:yes stop_codon:yes gene_type:complete